MPETESLYSVVNILKSGVSGLEYSIKRDPSYSTLVVDHEVGKLTGEAGLMTYTSPNIDVVTHQIERGIFYHISVARALREFVDWLWVPTSPRVNIAGLGRNPETGGARRW